MSGDVTKVPIFALNVTKWVQMFFVTDFIRRQRGCPPSLEITHFCATGQFRIVQNTSKTPQKSVLRWFWGSTGHFIFCRMRPSLGARGYQSIEGMAQLPTYRGIRYHRKVALPVAGRRFAAAPLFGERLCGPSGSPCNRQPTCI